MQSTDFTRTIQISSNTTQQNKALYGNDDQRLSLHQLESTNLDKSVIATVRKQAESIACLIHKDYLVEKGEGWQFHLKTPTLAQTVERQFQLEEASFGELEAFRDQLAPGFGTAFLVGKQIAMTAAHCICKKDTDIIDQVLIQQARLVFGFHEIKANSSDYFFAKKQVYQIKKVISHQFIRIQDKNHNFTDWTDWALLELNENVPFLFLRMNMTEKVADRTELYMLGHPSGLPLKFSGNGYVLGNTHKDFFECNLDAFGGNSGSFVAAKSTQVGSGMLCSGGTDYEITDNYKGTGKRRIQACHITKAQIAQKRIGERLENCQRVDTLRFLVSPELLGIEREGILPQQSAPELIVKSLQENYQSRNTIPRLLHKPLPIEEVYTELVLLEHSKEDDKKEGKIAFEEHRINSWEDIHGTKKPIDLANLFNAEGKAARRLLILGRAGIGKSILCQYIAYEWAQGKLWKGKFDALFWVPLRKLQHAHSLETTSSFLFRLCCQEHGQTLYPNDIADYLKQNKDRILFVLDGLDEVALEEDSLQKTIVDELLAFPHWILTSRPHAAASIQVDATIENVGFASQTIDVYIQKSFQANSQAMIQKIRNNPIIFGLCHIPINLELVCSILQKSKGDISFIRSMTSLYEELTLTLQRCFLEKLGKPSAWHWGSEDMEIDSEICSIFKLLESIAWEGMRKKALFFSFNQGGMEKIYYNSYLSSEADKREALFRKMCTSGFLQSTGESPLFLHNEYSFLHLTFQEFFAARYLVRLLQENPNEAAKCMQEVKFNPRYKVVMWFTAGLLRNEGGSFPYLNTFFDMLDTPKDSIGLYGALLKIRCLEECSWQKNLQKLKSYEQEIQFWIEKMALPRIYDHDDPITKHLMETFEISPQGAKSLFIPKVSSCMSRSSVNIRKSIINILGEMGQADPKAVLPLLIDALKDENRFVRAAAAKALSKVGQADLKAVLPLLIDALKDENSFVRGAAAIDLGKVGQADPKAVLPALIVALKDEDEYVRAFAAIALGQVGQAYPKTVLPWLIEALKDKEYLVRINAAIALGQVGQAYPKTLIESLKDEDWKVRQVAVKALGQVGQADPKTVLPLLIEALKDEHYFVGGAAAEALGQVGQTDPKAILPVLIEALKDEKVSKKFHDDWVRAAAAEALGQVGQADPKAVIPWLIGALKDEHKLVREAAAEALGQVGQADPKAVIPWLIGALKDENDWVRAAAAKALGQVGQADLKTVLLALIVVIKDEDDWVRLAAVKALGQVGQADLKTVLPALIVAIKDEYYLVKTAAAEALGQVGQADPKTVLPVLIVAIKDEDFLVKTAALEALGQVGQADPKTVLPVLIEILKDEVKFVREITTKALEKHDLSSYLRSNPLINDHYEETDLFFSTNLFFSTPLSSLITCYKENPTKYANYITAIIKKCIEENLAIFQKDDIVYFYEQGKICKIDFLKASEFLLQIEKLSHQYPYMINPSQKVLQANDEPTKSITIEPEKVIISIQEDSRTNSSLSPKSSEEKCSIQ